MDYDALIYVINRVERRDVDVVGGKKFVSKTIVDDRHALFRDCYSVNDVQRFKKKRRLRLLANINRYQFDPSSSRASKKIRWDPVIPFSFLSHFEA